MSPRLHRRSTQIFGVLAAALGAAILVETALLGGGVTGFLFGTLFLAVGCGRLYLLRRR